MYSYLFCYHICMRKQSSLIANRAHQWLENPWPFAVLVGTALIYVAFVDSGLSEEILDNESIVRVDGWLVHWLAAHRTPVSYTHLRAHETRHDLVCRLLLEKKKK